MSLLFSNKEEEITEVETTRSDFELSSDPITRDYQIGEFTASEYWRYIMRFGKRKMTKDEWRVWDGKKQREEKQRYENYLLKF